MKQRKDNGRQKSLAKYSFCMRPACIVKIIKIFLNGMNTTAPNRACKRGPAVPVTIHNKKDPKPVPPEVQKTDTNRKPCLLSHNNSPKPTCLPSSSYDGL